MPARTEALLVYGADLVLPGGPWQVHESDDDGVLTRPWARQGVDGDGEPLSDVETAILVLYSAIPGVERVAPPYPWQWEEPVFDHWGVKFVRYGTSEEPGWLIASAARACGLAGVEPLEMRVLVARADEERRQAQLGRALGKLGLTPLAPISWYLTVWTPC